MSASKTKRNSFILVLTALIWGLAFVAQSEGDNIIGPYAFASIRYIIGGIVLLPVIAFLDKTGNSPNKPKNKAELKTLLLGGLSCGSCLAVASLLQQVGIYLGTPAGKAGFLTACYIILVPIFGLFVKRKCGLNVWLSVIIAVAGLYLLCIKGSLSIEKNDALVLLCSIVYSWHILVIDRFIEKNADSVRMSCIQFFVASVIAAVPAFIIDIKCDFSAVPAMLVSAFTGRTLIAILYTGVMSSGVAYTLQIVGQKDVNPTVASLLMSLESVFSVLGGWLILGDKLTARELIGCGVMFCAIVLSQIPVSSLKRTSRSKR
ncbi:MAG: DMT family transporter [Eubacterium sp.]|nr:DMT family transporter [Eubacterium sp.]